MYIVQHCCVSDEPGLRVVSRAFLLARLGEPAIKRAGTGSARLVDNATLQALMPPWPGGPSD